MDSNLIDSSPCVTPFFVVKGYGIRYNNSGISKTDIKLCKKQIKSHCSLAAAARCFHAVLRDKPETDMREIAVLRFLCIGCWSEQ